MATLTTNRLPAIDSPASRKTILKKAGAVIFFPLQSLRASHAKSMCIYQATGIRGDNPYACKITFKDKDNFIRGQIEVGRVEADDRFTVLGSSTMD